VDFRDKLKQDRLQPFTQERPKDVTEDAWDAAKRHAEVAGTKLSKALEQSCFYYYSMGDSYEEVSRKLDLPIGMLVYTGLAYEWHKKKFAIDHTTAGTKIAKAETAAADLIADSIVATAAVYRAQLAEVIKHPETAKDCPLIPRNVKELQVLLQLLEVAQPKKDPAPSNAPSVHVNIANMGGQPAVTATQSHMDALPMSEEDGPDIRRLEVLKMLKQVKVGGN